MASIYDEYKVGLEPADYDVAIATLSTATYTVLVAAPTAGRLLVIHNVLAQNLDGTDATNLSLYAGERQILAPVLLKADSSNTLTYALLRPHLLRAGEALRSLLSVGADVNVTVHYTTVSA